MMTYSEDWSLNYREARNPLTIESAAKYHQERRRYAVACGAGDFPVAVVLMTGKSAQIEFFDDSQRPYLSFQFQERKPNQLFLTMATHREFTSGSDKPASAVTFIFEEDGSGHIREYDGITMRTKVRTMERADVSQYWEPYPEFGHYEGLLRVERVL